MIARPPTTMPPTTDPAALLRKANTNRIQNAFTNPNPGLLGPPTVQPALTSALPPRMPPIAPPQHIDPIGVAQGDPFTTAPNPGLLGPPTHQPPHPAGPQPFAYQVFQNALNQSGRSPGGEFGTPGAMSGGGTPAHASSQTLEGGFEEPPLPTNPGPSDPPPDTTGSNNYGPSPTPILQNNGDDGSLDPWNPAPNWQDLWQQSGNNGNDPYPNPGGITIYPGGQPIPGEDGQSTGQGNIPGGGYTPIGGETWLGGTPAGIDPTTGNPIFNPLGYGQFPDGGDMSGGDIPGGSGRGGTAGGPSPDTVWDAGLGRFVSIYGLPVGQLAHMGMEAYRNYRMTHPAGGPGGRGGGDSNSGNPQGQGQGETPDERARGDRNFTMAGGNSYYDAPVSQSHWNPGTGRYEMDRAAQGFQRNFAPEQQISDPFKFGWHGTTDTGRSLNTLAQLTQAQRARVQRIQPRGRALNTVQQAMNAGQGYG